MNRKIFGETVEFWLVGLLFAGVPALFWGVAAAWMHSWEIGLLFGVPTFLLGLRVVFGGMGRDDGRNE